MTRWWLFRSCKSPNRDGTEIPTTSDHTANGTATNGKTNCKNFKLV